LSAQAGFLAALPLMAMLAGLVIYPSLRLVVDAGNGSRGLRSYLDFFSDPVTMRAFLTTLRVGAVVTVLTVSLSWVVGWQLAHARSRLWRVVLWVATLAPLVMGVVVKNYVFTVLLQSNGAVNSTLEALHLIDEPLELLFTEKAVVLGMLYTMLPYGILPMFVASRQVDPGLLRASEGLGASSIYTMRRVVVPLTGAAAIRTAVLVFVISIGFYVTPILLGGAQSPFIASVVQNDIYFYNDYQGAATGSAILLLSALALLAATALASLLLKQARTRGRA
jgi:putative spermidine/putrescine transport system permease protein